MVKEVKDYVDAVQKEFPYFTKSEINHILTFGLKCLTYVNKMRCDVLFKDTRKYKYIAYIGSLTKNTFKHYLNWVTKWRMKERVLFYLRKDQWDGYYYIGLNDEQHNEIMKQKGKTKHFKNIYLTLIEKELYHNKLVTHIWRVPFLTKCGFKFFLEKFNSDKAEYRGENQYAKYHKCFLGRYNQ